MADHVQKPGEPWHGLTRVDGQHPDVFPSSPSGLIGVFVSILQARFYDQSSKPLPWVWDPDPTPDEDDGGALPEDGPDESPPPRRIFIERGSDPYPRARDVRPALLVTRGRVQYIKMGMGNRVAHEYPHGASMLMCHAIVPITVACLSRDDGESASLADVVASFFIGSSFDIREMFSIHSIEMPSIEESTIYKRQEASTDFWNTPVQVLVEIKYKWWRWPLAPVLREFVMKLDVDGDVRDLRAVLQRRTP